MRAFDGTVVSQVVGGRIESVTEGCLMTACHSVRHALPSSP